MWSKIVMVFVLGALFSEGRSLSPYSKISEEKGLGEAPTRYVVRFLNPFYVEASILRGNAMANVSGEARGFLIIKGGRLVPADSLDHSVTGTHCVLRVRPELVFGRRAVKSGSVELNRKNLEFGNFHLEGSLKVRDVLYEYGMNLPASGSRRMGEAYNTGILQIKGGEGKDKSTVANSVIGISIKRRYFGDLDDKDNTKKYLDVTPEALKSCFGEPVEIEEVPQKMKQ